MFPIDTIKTHVQASNEKYDGFFKTMKKITNKNGYRGLFRGIGAIALGSGQYFHFSIKLLSIKKKNNPPPLFFFFFIFGVIFNFVKKKCKKKKYSSFTCHFFWNL